MPNREELKIEIKKLQDVSARNELLTKQLSEGKGDVQALQTEVQKCIDEQSRIVETFINLSDNEPLKEEFQNIVKDIEALTKQMETEKDEKTDGELKDKILQGIKKWVECLEKIITEVIEQAK